MSTLPENLVHEVEGKRYVVSCKWGVMELSPDQPLGGYVFGVPLWGDEQVRVRALIDERKRE